MWDSSVVDSSTSFLDSSSTYRMLLPEPQSHGLDRKRVLTFNLIAKRNRNSRMNISLVVVSRGMKVNQEVLESGHASSSALFLKQGTRLLFHPEAIGRDKSSSYE